MKFKTARGTRDFMPEDMRKLQFVVDTARQVFERYGYEPIETPAFEEWKLLSAKSGGGDDIKKEIYYFKDKSNRELGLRFDLTVPLARVVANNPQIPKPFRRYQIGRVWRYDRPQAGRYREFWQADVDIVGVSGQEADAEVICIAADVLKLLGFNDFKIRLNNRKVAEGMLKSVGISKSNIYDIFRIIDKIKKIGKDRAQKELEKIVKGKGTQIIGMISAKRPNISKYSDEGAREIEKIINILKNSGFGKNVELDMSLVRGFEYYTGPIFEICIPDAGFSIAGGGRYDKMIEKIGGRSMPATGISLGIARIIDAMNKRGLFREYSPDFYIAVLSENVYEKAIKIALLLRKNFKVVLGFPRGLSAQLKYAGIKRIPKVLIIGENDVKQGFVTLKDMISGNEKRIRIADIQDVINKQ